MVVISVLLIRTGLTWITNCRYTKFLHDSNVLGLENDFKPWLSPFDNVVRYFWSQNINLQFNTVAIETVQTNRDCIQIRQQIVFNIYQWFFNDFSIGLKRNFWTCVAVGST